MTSAIDVTKPTTGKAYTADVRANFASAKSEIEALQALSRGQEVSLWNYLTAAQQADAAAGNLTFNADTYIQAAIDYATSLSSYSNARSIINVRIPVGVYKLSASITVKAHVNLICDGVLKNQLASSTAFCVTFKAKSHCTKLALDANSQGGVVFGEAGVVSDMLIGDVRITNVGKAVNQIGLRFLGYNIVFDTIQVDGGNYGIDFGDSGGNGAFHIRGSRLVSYSADTGIRMAVLEHINISTVIINSSNTLGLLLDNSHDVSLPNLSCFFDDTAPGTAFAGGVALNLGSLSAGVILNNIKMSAKVQNTGGTALRLANITSSNIELQANNRTLTTGNGHNCTQGIEYRTGIDASTTVVMDYQSALTATSGTVAGSLTKNKGDTIFYSLPIAPPYILMPNSTPFESHLSRVTADQTITNNVTLGNITGLLFSPEINTEWLFEFVIFAGAVLSTTGIQLAVTFPAGTTQEIDASIHPTVYTAANIGLLRTTTAGAALDFTAAGQVAVNGAKILIHGWVSVGATVGSVQAQFAQSTNSATALTIRKGSYCRAFRVTI